MGREGHRKQTPLACVGSACSGWTTLGLPQPKAACTSWVHPAQAPGCSARALSQVGPAFCALPRSRLLRFWGALQGHRPRWAVSFVPFPAPSDSGNWVLGECTVPGGSCILITSPSWPLGVPGVSQEHCLRCAVCLLCRANLRLQPSWRLSTIQDLRKMWLAARSLLTVW